MSFPFFPSGPNIWPVENHLVRLCDLPSTRCHADLIPGTTCVVGDAVLIGADKQPHLHRLVEDFDNLKDLCPRMFLVTLTDAVVVIEPGLDGVIFMDGAAIMETQRFCKFRNARSNVCRGRRLIDPDDAIIKSKVDRAFISFDPGWTNYFHWITLTAPKLLAADSLLPADIPFFLPDLENYRGVPRPPAFSEKVRSDSIAALKLSRPVTNILPGYYHINQLHLIMPDVWQQFSLVGHSVYRRAFERWQANVRPLDTPLSKRIFLSRALTKDPRLPLAEGQTAAFAEVLDRAGLVTVQLEGLEWVHQVNLFRNADLVLGAIGSGNTNMLFASERTKLVEIMVGFGPELKFRSICFYLAAMLGQKYTYLDGSRELLTAADFEGALKMMLPL